MGLGHIMTLANSIIGVSVLAMPFCFKQCGIILSILVLFLSSIMTRLACHFLLKAAVLARRRNYEFLAFHAFGPKGKLMVELCIIGFLFGTCIAFFVVMGDLGPAIISEVLGINKSPSIRSSVLLGLALLVVLPLGLLRNVDSLSSLCTATILFYFFLVLKIMSEATTHLLAGDWLQYVHLWRPAGILQCIPIFAMALSCQTQVFEIYETLPDPSLPKMNEVVRAAVNICTGVYVCMGFFGYVAVCRPPPPSAPPLTGNILMSFPSSFTMQAIKLFFVASVACSFPLVIFPCRASLHSLLFRRAPHHETGIGVSGSGGGSATASTASLLPPGSSAGQAIERIPERRFRLLTISLVAGSLAVAFALPDIELVLGLVGSSIGTITCLLLPALCFLKVAPSHPYRHSHWGGGKGVTAERLLAQVMIVVGTTILILSTYANLHAVDQARTEEPVTPHPLHEGGGVFPKVPVVLPPGKLSAGESNIIIPETLPKAVQVIEGVKKAIHLDNPGETAKHSPGSMKKDTEMVKAVLVDGEPKEVKAEKRQEPPVPVAPDHSVKKKPPTSGGEKAKKVAEKNVEASKQRESKTAVLESEGGKDMGGMGGGAGVPERAALVPQGVGKEVDAPDSVHGDAIKKEEEEVVIEEVAAERDEERRRRQEEEEEEGRKRAEKERKEKELLQKLADDRKKQQEQINMQMEILKKLQALEEKKSEPGKNSGGGKGESGNVVSGKKLEKVVGESRVPVVPNVKAVPDGDNVPRDKLADKEGNVVQEASKQVSDLKPDLPMLPVKKEKKTDLTRSQALDISQNEAVIQKKIPSDEKVMAKEDVAQAYSSNRDKPLVMGEMKVANPNVSSISQMKAALPMPLLLGVGQQEGTLVKESLKAKEREKREVDVEGPVVLEKAAVQDGVVDSVVKECEGDCSENVKRLGNVSEEMAASRDKGDTSSQGMLVEEFSNLSAGDVIIKDSLGVQESRGDPKTEYEKISIEKSALTKVDEVLSDKISKGIVAICGDKMAATRSPLLCSFGAKEPDDYLSPTIKTLLRLSDPVNGKSFRESDGTKVTLDGVMLEAMPLKRDLKYVQNNDGDSIDKVDSQ